VYILHMILERALFLLVLGVGIWLGIRYLVTPLLSWALAPTIRIIEAKQRRRVAEAELRAAEEEAKTFRVETQTEQVLTETIDELTQPGSHKKGNYEDR
jgi:hypothetical protein